MEVVRTCKLKLMLPAQQALRLVDTYTSACNYASHLAFSLNRPSSTADLNQVTYRGIRAFGLSAQVAQSAIRAVASKYTVLKKLKRPAKEPVCFHGEPVQLQGGERGRDFRFAGNQLSITTLEGRVKVRFQGPPKLAEYLASWKMGGARLLVRSKKVYLLVSFSREAPVVERPNNAVIGVDRGLKQIAVATDGKACLFAGSGRVLHRRRYYRNQRASIQSRKAHKKTRSLRRLQTRLRGKEKRFQTDVNHVVSKRIIEMAAKTGCPTIAVEDLKGIRGHGRRSKKFRTEVGAWAFYQLQGFIEYKAQERGFGVIYVNAAYTSQGCCRCGYTDKSNRKGLLFVCGACGLKLHADLNASRNVRLRGILARQVPGKDGAPSTAPEVPGSSGTSPAL